MNDELPPYDQAAAQAVELGNRIADGDADADLWDVADGLLAGALQYWLYTRQPCGEPDCQDCAPLATAEMRLKELQRLVDELARTSEYFHSTNDFGAGHA
jgi:hypothetical protein